MSEKLHTCIFSSIKHTVLSAALRTICLMLLELQYAIFLTFIGDQNVVHSLVIFSAKYLLTLNILRNPKHVVRDRKHLKMTKILKTYNLNKNSFYFKERSYSKKFKPC